MKQMKQKETKIELGNFKHITKPGNMTILTMQGRTIFVTGLIKIDDILVPGQVYDLNTSGGDICLTYGNPLPLPQKIYDFEQDFRNQILSTLRHKDSNMNIGVLLEGYKGQGKSVIAKQLAIESGLPVVVINGAIPKDINFTGFLAQIKQDYCLLLDEFEKNFHNDDFKNDKESNYHGQNSFLSLFDGMSGLANKRLVILTSNKEIGDKFLNRPSRIRYYKKFNFMNKKVFDAIVKDKLKNKKYAKDLEDSLDVPSCTIDILTTIIEEINIQNKPYSKFKDIFNRRDKETCYTIYVQNADSKKWVEVDEIKTTREMGIEAEYFQNIFGYHAKMLKNEEDTVYYEDTEYYYENEGTEQEKYLNRKVIKKAIKRGWSKASTSYTF